MEEIEYEGDTHDLEMAEQKDFTHKVAESLPEPLGKWMTNGDHKTRVMKFMLILCALFVVVILIFGVIVSVTLLVNLGEGGESSDITNNSNGWNSTFLPDWAFPSAYEISLSPDLVTFELTGTVHIHFQVSEDSHDYLILNSLDIEINTVELASHPSIELDMIEYLEDLEMVVLHFTDELPTEEDLELVIVYRGTIQEEMAGFYRSVYTDNNGEEHWLASTQFEPTAARLAFPCFDEPDKKATFIITLIYEDTGNTVTLSNMPVESKTTKNGKTTVTFEETPIMSTYLVAFLVGDFGSVEGEYNGMPVKVWAPIGQEEQGWAALNVTIASLEYYEDFFNEPYTLPKLDLVAIPDFEAGAMENWGLITFRLTALLFNPAEDSAGNLQRVATVVTHEMAHQWTGDLVTMGWWSNLWLNEGFADFWETESVANILPLWKMRDQFLVEDQQRAFSVDSLLSTRSVVHEEVLTSSDISEMFDTITYSKGGSILRMMQDVLGVDVFRDALRNYIQENKFGNVLTDDFLDSVSATTEQPITDNFHGWLYEPGFPVVTVTIDGKKVTFTQERFISSMTGENVTSDSLWWLNIKYTTGSEEGEISFNKASKTITLESAPAFIKANMGQNGFYRVNYPTNIWIELKNNIQQFTAADRAGLVNDVLVLARAGRIETSTALEFTSFLSQETEYTVWVSALSQLGYLGTMLSTEADYGLYEQFVQDLIAEVVDYVGWYTLSDSDENDHNKSLLRAVVLDFAVRFQLPSAVEQAVSIWKDYKANGTFIAPDDRQAVYCAALHYGDSSDYHFLFEHLLETDNAAEKNRVLYTLGCTRELYLLQFTLNSALDSSIVRPQDQRTAIAGVSANPLGRDLAWNFVQTNFETFNTLGFSLSSLISIVTSPFNDNFHLQEVEMFFSIQETVGASKAVEQSIETISSNIQWLKSNGEDISQFLRSRYQK